MDDRTNRTATLTSCGDSLPPGAGAIRFLIGGTEAIRIEQDGGGHVMGCEVPRVIRDPLVHAALRDWLSGAALTGTNKVGRITVPIRWNDISIYGDKICLCMKGDRRPRMRICVSPGGTIVADYSTPRVPGMRRAHSAGVVWDTLLQWLRDSCERHLSVTATTPTPQTCSDQPPALTALQISRILDSHWHDVNDARIAVEREKIRAKYSERKTTPMIINEREFRRDFTTSHEESRAWWIQETLLNRDSQISTGGTR